MTLNLAVGNTPMEAVTVTCGDTVGVVRFKLESFNPTGSTKDRTAAGILQSMEQIAPLMPGDVVVESTSGNLGLAMVRLLTMKGCQFVAVVDLNTPEQARLALVEAGAELVVVDEPDGQGGYLLNRLRTVRELCARHPEYRWGNQYGNPANPAIHYQSTGPELLAQAGPDLDTVYVAVSTGGTLAGVSSYLRARSPGTRVVAVDAEGSLVTGNRVAPRMLSGIGASRHSTFLAPGSYDRAIQVGDADSFAMCRLLMADTGLVLGGSSGSVLAACVRELREARPPVAPVCLCPDDGRKYLDAFYDDRWLARNGLLEAVERSTARFRELGVSFAGSDRTTAEGGTA
jgi:N-(2-amino-2-carboxyethyl)-L-glutamate synthase